MPIKLKLNGRTTGANSAVLSSSLGAAAGAAVSSAAGVVGFSSSDILITVYDAKCEYMVRL